MEKNVLRAILKKQEIGYCLQVYQAGVDEPVEFSVTGKWNDKTESLPVSLHGYPNIKTRIGIRASERISFVI